MPSAAAVSERWESNASHAVDEQRGGGYHKGKSAYTQVALHPCKCIPMAANFGSLAMMGREYRQDRTGEGLHLGEALYQYFWSRGYKELITHGSEWLSVLELPEDVNQATPGQIELVFRRYARKHPDHQLELYRSKSPSGDGFSVGEYDWGYLLFEVRRTVLKPVDALAKLLEELSTGRIPAKRLDRMGRSEPVPPEFWNRDNKFIFEELKPYLQWPLDVLDPEIFIARGPFQEFQRKADAEAKAGGYKLSEWYTIDLIAALAPEMYVRSLYKFRQQFSAEHSVSDRRFRALMKTPRLQGLLKASGGQRGIKRKRKRKA